MHTRMLIEALLNSPPSLLLVAFLSNPGISVFKVCLAFTSTMLLAGIGTSVCLHRYFSHCAFETSRPMTFVLAVIGSLANQKGCLWWASNHVKHHKYCDRPGDPHSQIQDGFWFAFVGWMLVSYKTDFEYVPKRVLTPESLFLNRFHWLPKTILIAWLCRGLGYEWAFWGYILPALVSVVGVMSFNITNHPKALTNRETMCNAMDGIDVFRLGESRHKHHHRHPNLARRPGMDLPYHLVLRPLYWAGVIW